MEFQDTYQQELGEYARNHLLEVLKQGGWNRSLDNLSLTAFQTSKHELQTSSCPLHLWCHPAISSSDSLFSFCCQSFLASGTFPMSQLFTLDDQNTDWSLSQSLIHNGFTESADPSGGHLLNPWKYIRIDILMVSTTPTLHLWTVE